jgi:hypothetical protein
VIWRYRDGFLIPCRRAIDEHGTGRDDLHDREILRASAHDAAMKAQAEKMIAAGRSKREVIEWGSLASFAASRSATRWAYLRATWRVANTSQRSM